MNYVRTGVLLAALTGLFLAVGYALGGEGGMLIALLLAGGMNLFAWWNSDKMLLRMHGARQVDERSAPQLVGLVRQLAQRAELPMPAVYVIDQEQPNAFATGRNPENAAVAVTSGLMRILTIEELAGVLAHELAHIRNRDTLIMTVTATVAGAIGMLANMFMFMGLFGRGEDRPNPIVGLAVMLLAPIGAALVQMAISRTREYDADAHGAAICGHPVWLADALAKLERGAQRIDNPVAENNPATAHLFIVNPLHGRPTDNLFSTHPKTANRIARLRELAGLAPQAAPPRAFANPWRR